jgi:hypothetical protein
MLARRENFGRLVGVSRTTTTKIIVVAKSLWDRYVARGGFRYPSRIRACVIDSILLGPLAAPAYTERARVFR